MNNTKGFTLIELLIVVILLGGLSTIALNVVNRNKKTDAAKNAVVRSNLLKASESLHAFVQLEGYVPQDLNGNGDIADEEGVSTYVKNWPSGTPDGAIYTYNFIPGTPNAFSVDATRFDTGCLSYCSIDRTIFEDVSGCAYIVNSCTVPSTPPPPPPACGDGTCNGTESCSTCSSDCGTCSPPPPVCGDGTCNGTESCSTCSSDCGTCSLPPPVCGDGICNGAELCSTCSTDCGNCSVWVEPSPTSCPAGTTEIGVINDFVISSTDHTIHNVKTFSFNLTRTSRVTVVGYGGEGHPSDCPDGALCYACPNGGRCGEPPQSTESFKVFVEGPPEELIGTYQDSGLNPDDGWYPLQGQPWKTSVPRPLGQVNIRVEHFLLDQFPAESVSLKLTVCEDL